MDRRGVVAEDAEIDTGDDVKAHLGILRHPTNPGVIIGVLDRMQDGATGHVVFIEGNVGRAGDRGVKGLDRGAFVGEADETTVGGIPHKVVSHRGLVLNKILRELKGLGIDGRGVGPVVVHVDHLVGVTKAIPPLFTAICHEIRARGVVGVIEEPAAAGPVDKLRIQGRKHAVRERIGGVQRRSHLFIYPLAEINNLGIIFCHFILQ